MTASQDLSVSEALSKILTGVSVLKPELVSLANGLGRVLAERVQAKDSLPSFANSSMDGYAVRAEDVSEASDRASVALKVIADIAAGSISEAVIVTGTAARIMTGAPMPVGANAVVPVEDTSEPWRDDVRPLPENIEIRRAVAHGDFVRYPGEDIVAGTEVLPAGHVIRAQEIGVLAALGVAQLRVISPPRVGVLATGDELIAVEETLTPGKIRNSNSYAQTAQIEAVGAVPISLGVAGDSERSVRTQLEFGLQTGVDLFVSSAGVSVGAFDVVKSVLDKGGDVAFWRVRMRPGKPLAFGTYGNVPYLGLPGNPVSAMVSFERFVRPAILKMAGHVRTERPTVAARLKEEIFSDGRESYLRAIVTRGPDGYWAEPTGRQGSHIMTSLVKANALVIVPEGKKHVAANEVLQAMMIDWPEGVF